MSSGQRETLENLVVGSDAVEQQARLGFEPDQGVQEQQNIEDASIDPGEQEQQNVEDSSAIDLGEQEPQNIQGAGLGLETGAIQPTQVGSGHNSGQQQPANTGSTEREENIGEGLVQWQIRRAGELRRHIREEQERAITRLLRRSRNRLRVREYLRQEHQLPAQAGLEVHDNGFQARTGHNQTPNGRPQQGRATSRMPDQQMPNDHPQQGTARRRMRLQVSSLHLDTDSKGSVLLRLECSDAFRSCNALNARSFKVKLGGAEVRSELKDVSSAPTEGPKGTRTYRRMPLDKETRKLKGYIKGLRSAESNYSTRSGSLSSLTSSMPSLAALMILLLGLLGFYLHLQLSRPLIK